MNHVHTHTCLFGCNASLHPCSIDLAFFHPPPTSNHLLQTSNGRDRWFGKATEFSDTLGRSVFTPEITHFIQRPSYEDHCGEKDDVDDQVRVFVELCYNLDLLVGEIVDGDETFVGLLQMMGFANEVVSGLGGFRSGDRFSSQALRLFASRNVVDRAGSVF